MEQEVYCDQGHRLTLMTTQKPGANNGRDFYTGGTQCGAFQWANMHFETQVIKCKEKKPYNPPQQTQPKQIPAPTQQTPQWLQTKKNVYGSPQILQRDPIPQKQTCWVPNPSDSQFPSNCQPIHNQPKPLMLDYTIKQISSVLVTEIEGEKSIPQDKRLSVLIEIFAQAAREIQISILAKEINTVF